MELDLATTLKEFRQQHAMEQAELARLLETTQQTVSNWESGTMPRSGMLRRITHLIANYHKELPLAPVPPRPSFDPAISAIHDIRVNTEYDARRAVAESLQNIASGPSQPRFISSRQEFEDQVAYLLRPDLGYTTNEVAEYQGLRRRVDFLNKEVACNLASIYVSTNFAVDDVRRTAIQLTRTVEMNAIRLTTVRAIHHLHRCERSIYALLVKVPDDLLRQAGIGQAMTLAALHDLRLVLVTTSQQGADALFLLADEAKRPNFEPDLLEDPDHPW